MFTEFGYFEVESGAKWLVVVRAVRFGSHDGQSVKPGDIVGISLEGNSPLPKWGVELARYGIQAIELGKARIPVTENLYETILWRRR